MKAYFLKVKAESEVATLQPKQMISDQTKKQTMERQPLWATVALAIIAVTGIVAITYVRIKTQDVPAGLVALTASAVTGVVMSCGRRRI